MDKTNSQFFMIVSNPIDKLSFNSLRLLPQAQHPWLPSPVAVPAFNSLRLLLATRSPTQGSSPGTFQFFTIASRLRSKCSATSTCISILYDCFLRKDRSTPGIQCWRIGEISILYDCFLAVLLLALGSTAVDFNSLRLLHGMSILIPAEIVDQISILYDCFNLELHSNWTLFRSVFQFFTIAS